MPTLSFLPGFPAADFPDCGATVVAYGATQADADRAADAVAARVMASESAFNGQVYQPEEGVREAMALAGSATKPIVISDTQDNPGAGGDSDTMGMVRALIACGAQRAAIGLIVDAEPRRPAHEAGEGATIIAVARRQIGHTRRCAARRRLSGRAPVGRASSSPTVRSTAARG